MNNIFTRSLVYTNFLNVLKVVVLKLNGKPINYCAIPKSNNILNDYAKDIASCFSFALSEGYTIKAIDDLQKNGKASIEINTKIYSFELVDGKLFDEKYVAKD